MTVRGIVATAMRVFALWMLVFSVQSAGVMAYAYSDSPWWVLASGLLLGLIIMYLLWRFADPIAKRLVPAAPSDQVAGITHSGLFQTGCCLIGLLTISAALPEIVKAMGWVVISSGPAYADAGPKIKLMLVVALAKLAVGAFLLLRSMAVTQLARVDG